VVEHAGLSLYLVSDLVGYGYLTYNTLLVGWMGYVKDDFFLYEAGASICRFCDLVSLHVTDFFLEK
jgi:hypothetical protein